MNSTRALRTTVLLGTSPCPRQTLPFLRIAPSQSPSPSQWRPRLCSRRGYSVYYRRIAGNRSIKATTAKDDIDEADLELSEENDWGDDGGGEDTSSAETQLRQAVRQGVTKTRYAYAASFLRRIGRCLAFGCNAEQTAEAARLARIVAEDWANIQMGRGNSIVHPNGVHHDRIDRRNKEGKDWEPFSEVFGILPRAFPLPAIAEKAVLKFFEYAYFSANVQARIKWDQLRKKQYKVGILDSHHGIGFLLNPPIFLRTINWPIVMPQASVPSDTRLKYVRAVQNVSVYTRLESFDEINGRVRMTLRASVWSRTSHALIAEAQIKIVLWPLRQGRAPSWLLTELDRLIRHSSPDMVELYRNMTAALERLEAETWNREDAVEHLGSATWTSANKEPTSLVNNIPDGPET